MSGLAITVTVGVANWESAGIDDLIKHADAALYAGKANGRNTVALVTPNSLEHDRDA